MFTLSFVVFLLGGVAVSLWLAQRQIRHVRMHRDRVPERFTERIALSSHQPRHTFKLLHIICYHTGPTRQCMPRN